MARMRSGRSGWPGPVSCSRNEGWVMRRVDIGAIALEEGPQGRCSMGFRPIAAGLSPAIVGGQTLRGLTPGHRAPRATDRHEHKEREDRRSASTRTMSRTAWRHSGARRQGRGSSCLARDCWSGAWAYKHAEIEGSHCPCRAFSTIAPMIARFAPAGGRPCWTLPLGTAYTVWTGIGAVGSFLVGIACSDEDGDAHAPDRRRARRTPGIVLMKLISALDAAGRPRPHAESSAADAML